MSALDELVDRIKSIPDSSFFLAEFASTASAIDAIKRLSFARVDPQRGVALPSNVLCQHFRTGSRVVLCMGGSLSESQCSEITNVLKRSGEIKVAALPRSFNGLTSETASAMASSGAPGRTQTSRTGILDGLTRRLGSLFRMR